MPKKKSTTVLPTPTDPTAGKGMPEKTPLAQRSRPGKLTTPADSSAEASLALPHERDQSTDMTSQPASPEVVQGARDLKKGIKDTSKAPEMDKAYKKLKT